MYSNGLQRASSNRLLHPGGMLLNKVNTVHPHLIIQRCWHVRYPSADLYVVLRSSFCLQTVYLHFCFGSWHTSRRWLASDQPGSTDALSGGMPETVKVRQCSSRPVTVQLRHLHLCIGLRVLLRTCLAGLTCRF